MRRKVQISHWALLAAVGLLSVALLYLAWPRMQASVRYLPVDKAIARYRVEQVIPTDRLEVLIRFAHEAISQHDHYRYRDGLSLLYYLQAMDVYTPALQRRQAYRQSETEATKALQRAPAQPAAWLRLAHIHWILHDEAESIIQAWKMSVFTGRTHSKLYAPRVELGIAQAEYLDEEARAMLRDQLLLAWRARPGTLIQVLARRDPGLAVTRSLLSNSDPEALTEMEVWVEKVR